MTEQSVDRLDRIERILEQSAKEHAEWFTHIERMFANAAEQFISSRWNASLAWSEEQSSR